MSSPRSSLALPAADSISSSSVGADISSPQPSDPQPDSDQRKRKEPSNDSAADEQQSTATEQRKKAKADEERDDKQPMQQQQLEAQAEQGSTDKTRRRREPVTLWREEEIVDSDDEDEEEEEMSRREREKDESEDKQHSREAKTPANPAPNTATPLPRPIPPPVHHTTNEARALQSATPPVITALLHLYNDCIGTWLLPDSALDTYIAERIEGSGISPEWSTEQAIEDECAGLPRGTAADATDFMRRCIGRLTERMLWFAGDGEEVDSGYLFGLYCSPGSADDGCVLMWEYCNDQWASLLARSLADFAHRRTADGSGTTELDEAGKAAISSWLSEHGLGGNKGGQAQQVAAADEVREEEEEADEDKERTSSEWKVWFDARVIEVVRETQIL